MKQATAAHPALFPHLNPRFVELCPELDAETFEALERSVREHGVRDPLVVWKERGDLLDGRHRLKIVETHGLPMPAVVELSFPDERAAAAWVIENQLARRNLTPSEAAYLRGKRYQLLKRDRAANLVRGKQAAPMDQNDPSESQPRWAQQVVAASAGVSSATVKRDARFAKAVDTIAEKAGPGARAQILGPSGKHLRQRDVLAIAQLDDLTPDSLKTLAARVENDRRARPSLAPESAKPFFQRATRPKTLETYIDREDGKTYADRVQLICNHWHEYKRKVPVEKAVRAKSFTCPACGSGTRRAHERLRATIHLEAAIKNAVLSDILRPELVGFVQCALTLTSLKPGDARYERVLEDQVRHGQKAGFFDKPRAAATRRTRARSEEE